MRNNPIRRSNSALTLLAILSVLLAFSLICACCLFVVYRTGVFELPALFSKDPVPVETNGGEVVSLPVHTEKMPSIEPISDKTEAFEDLLSSLPFSDRYYISVLITTNGEGAEELSPAGTYEIWRLDEKYKIKYSVQNEEKRTVTCDGERVQIVDFEAITNRYFDFSPEYRFERMSPLPNFASLMHQIHDVFSYEEMNGVCSAAWEYTTLGFIDSVRLSMKDGMLLSFSRYKGGSIIWQIDVLSADDAVLLTDAMFRVD